MVLSELALGHADDDDLHELPESSDETVVEQLDNMLAKAKIEPELIESLGTGMRNLSDSAGKLSDMTSAADPTNSELVENIKGASSKVSELSSACDSAASSINEITNISAGDSNFGEQLSKVSGNLSELNNVCEMQLKGASDHKV